MLRGPPNDFVLQLGSNDNPIVESRLTLGIVHTLVPEPSTLTLLAIGAVGLLVAHKRLLSIAAHSDYNQNPPAAVNHAV